MLWGKVALARLYAYCRQEKTAVGRTPIGV